MLNHGYKQLTAAVKPLSPVFLRELRKAVVAGKKKKPLEASKANATSPSALKRQSGVGSEASTSRNSLHLAVSKRKAEELSSLDCPSEPASRRPEPEQRGGWPQQCLGAALLHTARIPTPFPFRDEEMCMLQLDCSCLNRFNRSSRRQADSVIFYPSIFTSDISCCRRYFKFNYVS